MALKIAEVVREDVLELNIHIHPENHAYSLVKKVGGKKEVFFHGNIKSLDELICRIYAAAGENELDYL